MVDKSETPVIELPGAGEHGSGSGTQRGYKVEVRSSHCNPKKLGDLVIDWVWRELPIAERATQWGCNIPLRDWDRDMLRHGGLLSYNAAEAHRWAFLAALDAQSLTGSLNIETRLVQAEFKYEHSTKEIGVTPPLKQGVNEWMGRIGGFGPRRPTESDEPEL